MILTTRSSTAATQQAMLDPRTQFVSTPSTVVAGTPNVLFSAYPDALPCEITDRLLHSTIQAVANVGTTLLVGTIVFRRRRHGWILPALAGAAAGQAASILTGYALNKVRKRSC